MWAERKEAAVEPKCSYVFAGDVWHVYAALSHWSETFSTWLLTEPQFTRAARKARPTLWCTSDPELRGHSVERPKTMTVTPVAFL